MKSLWIIALFFSAILAAQEKQLHFTNYTIKNGLPTSFITEIYQDKTGFIWIGNNNGLSRFDGNEFHNFYFDPNDSNSISGNRIYKITEDKQGRLWIATDHGLSTYIPGTDKFIRYTFNNADPNSLPGDEIYDIYCDSKGRLWIGSYDGFCRYNPDKNNFTRIYNNDNQFLFEFCNRISGIAEDKQGRLWLAPQNEGIYLFDPKKNTFTHYQVEGKYFKKNINPNSKIIYIDSSNVFWIGTRGNGFFKYKPGENNIERYQAQIGNDNLNNDIIFDMKDLTPGELWVGTDGGGINILNKSTGKFRHVMANMLVNNGLKSNATQVFIKDKQNNIWIGTVTSGIFVYSPYLNIFEQYRWTADQPINLSNNVVLETMEDKKGLLWIGTDGGGLCAFNRKDGTIKSYQHDPLNPQSLSSNVICDIYEDSRGNFWIGTFAGGLNLFNRENGHVTRYIPNENDSGSLSNENVWDILEDKKGNFWIGTLGGGLNLFDYKTKTFKRYIARKGEQNSIPSDIVNSVACDENGKIWLGTSKGLSLFDPIKQEFKRIKLFQGYTEYMHDDIHCVYKDKKGTIWAGASAGLLFKVDPVSLKAQRYDLSNGNLSNILMGITEDQSGILWLSSAYNLVSFDPENGTKRFYDEKDGLPTRQLTQTSSCLLKSGELAFGTNDGLVIFNPRDIKAYPYPPLLLLTELRVNNHPVIPGEKLNGRVLLDQPFYNTQNLVLTHKEREFTIKFSILQFVNQRKLKVLYKLEGFNEEWREADINTRSITYTYLPARTYKFTVKAENGDGVWSKPEVLTIVVLPPYWQQLWFRILMVIILLSCFGSVMLLRTRHLRNRKFQLESLIRQRTGELALANSQLETRQQEVVSQNQELYSLNQILEEQKEEIQQQNEKLDNYSQSLEKTVDERTRELQHALKKALESDKLKSSFLANMSHEIRTPMNSILGFSGLLQDVSSEPGKLKSYVDIILSSGKSLMLLIDDIIDFSKIEAGILEFHSTEFNLVNLLDELILAFQQENKNAKVLLRLSNSCDKNEVLFSDKLRTKQILTNLLSNALKFTDSGEVILGCRENACGNIELYVKDTGPGIPMDKADFIFEPFNKLEDNTEKLYRGAGLGLAISRYLAHTMQYIFKLDSEPGQGSTFSFTVPAKFRRTAQYKKVETIEITSVKQFLNKTILVAEDEINNYLFLEELMKRWGIKLIWARNGKECVEIASKDPAIDMILMDIKMPLMNGVEANKVIKANGFEKPVVALTAYASPSDRERYTAENFDGYLVKPVNSLALLEEIQKLLGI